MPAYTVVRARIDEASKEEAAAILDAAGLTLSDAFRMMIRRIVAEKALPFDPLIPNDTTIEAMKAARRAKSSRSARSTISWRICMRTISRTDRFKKDYKREARG